MQNLHLLGAFGYIKHITMSPLSGHPLTGHSLSGQNIFPVIRTVWKTGIRLTGNYHIRFVIRTTRCPDNEESR